MDRWVQYLYEQHSEAELKEWGARLRFFRYFRAYGGHANDGDSLDIALKYESTQSLIHLLRCLDIGPFIFIEKPDQPIVGRSYSFEEYSSFPSLIRDTEWIKQPGHCEIWGVKVFVWCDSGLINISASPGSYVVTSDHVAFAEKLEKNWKVSSRFSWIHHKIPNITYVQNFTRIFSASRVLLSDKFSAERDLILR